ncbi:putative RNA-directed DNA polymerase [Helianthus annuus]|nr:putative RNA-directed DNA polymerase [Helianthus annuus]
MSNDNSVINNDLSIQIANLLKNSLNHQNQSPKSNLSDSLNINLKLNSQNYPLWARMIRVAIGGKSKTLLKHLTESPPEPSDDKYEQWEQNDLIVFSWLIQNIEPALASNLTEFPTSKSLWDALVVTYSSGKDKLQTFDLHVKANEIKQNGQPLEDFWIVMQGIWGEIDRRDPNPMTCATDISTYNRIRSEQKLFQFLNAIDRQYDPIKREILRWDPLPSAEGAYAAVRKETAHQSILGVVSSGNLSQQGVAAGLATTGTNDSEGLGFLSKGRFSQTKPNSGSLNRIDKSKLKCTHCGMMKHTKDQCFKLVGFPEWWNDGHKKGKNIGGNDGGKTATTIGNSGTTNTGGGSTKNTENSGGFGGMASADFGDMTSTRVEESSNGGKGFESWFSNPSDIRTGAIIGRGTERQGLYYVEEVTQHGTVMLAHGSMDREAWLWHRRLGHPSIGYLHLLFPKLFPYNKPLNCETCVLAKSHRHTYKPNNTRVDLPFSLIHSDVWGPAEVIGGQNFRFFVLFIDDCTRMTWIYFLKNKSEVFDKFTMFYTMIQTQFKTNIQILRSDNGGEFINDSMKRFCQTKGIIHQTSCPHTPEQNGVVERKNRILLEITRALLIESRVPKSFWPEALATATYLINRLPTKALDLKTPLQTLSEFTKLPPALTLEPRIFGCSAFVHIPKVDRSKLGPCAEKCVFVGYGINQKGYRCYSPKRRHMYTTMDCDFLETEFFYTSQHSSQGETEYDTLSWLKWVPSSEEVNHSTQDESLASHQSGGSTISAANQNPPSLITEVTNSPTHEDVQNIESQENQFCDISYNHEIPIEQTVQEGQGEQTQEETAERYVLPPRANRGVPPKRYSPEKQTRSSRYPMESIAEGNLSREAKAFISTLYNEQIPNSVEQALESKNWKDAMEVEMKALMKNNTWERSTLPLGKKPVGCRWVFTIKYKPDGTIERYKARLVAKGYSQTYGIDYSETFSPVAKIDTIRVLFSIAANEGWPLHQFDVKNAFLHGELKEEVYMEAPPGFTEQFKPGEVCRLRRSIYGLKQSPRAWFGRFTLAMKKYGFQQSNSDHTLFLKRRGKFVTCLIIYVDDMIITGNDEEEIKKLKANLFMEFEMKDLGRLKYFLGIEVMRSKQGIFICQKKYILDLLAETGMIDCKPADTPMIMNHKLHMEEEAELADRERYQRLVGKLIYLSHTRPDIAYAVGVVSQFMHQPQVSHMEAVWRIIRYLKGTTSYGILFQPNKHLKIQAYTDADWAGDKGNRRSTSGYFTLVGGNLVTWKSKKQKVVALSSAEAEFRGIARGLAEVLWIRKLLSEIGFSQTSASSIMCDNEAAIQISENPVQHDRTKHVEVDRHFIKEKLEAGIIELPFVRSEDQLADILTKAVNGRILNQFLDKLSIGDPTTQLEGEC